MDELANIELSDDEGEGDGRSVAQEVDYSNRKRAMKEIKKANFDQIQKNRSRRMNRKQLNSIDDIGSQFSGASLSLASSRKKSIMSNAARSILSKQGSQRSRYSR